MIHQFKLESLKDLDSGKAAVAFEKHLQRAANDCMDRPGDAKARKVKFEVSLTPVLQDDLDCTEVKATLHVSSEVPKHKTKEYSFGLRKNGVMVFNEDSPDSIDQATLLPDREDD